MSLFVTIQDQFLLPKYLEYMVFCWSMIDFNIVWEVKKLKFKCLLYISQAPGNWGTFSKFLEFDFLVCPRNWWVHSKSIWDLTKGNVRSDATQSGESVRDWHTVYRGKTVSRKETAPLNEATDLSALATLTLTSSFPIHMKYYLLIYGWLSSWVT